MQPRNVFKGGKKRSSNQEAEYHTGIGVNWISPAKREPEKQRPMYGAPSFKAEKLRTSGKSKDIGYPLAEGGEADLEERFRVWALAWFGLVPFLSFFCILCKLVRICFFGEFVVSYIPQYVIGLG